MSNNATFRYTFHVPNYWLRKVETDYAYVSGKNYPPHWELEGCAATLELIDRFGAWFNEKLLKDCAWHISSSAVDRFVTDRAWQPMPAKNSSEPGGWHAIGLAMEGITTCEAKTLAELFELVKGLDLTPTVIRAFSQIARGAESDMIIRLAHQGPKANQKKLDMSRRLGGRALCAGRPIRGSADSPLADE